jgi:GC-rich sequence DNA-binding factor
MTSSHASHTSTLSSLADERSALESKEAEMRQLVENAEKKRSWFVAFQEWVESIASFLDEKVARVVIFIFAFINTHRNICSIRL